MKQCRLCEREEREERVDEEVNKKEINALLHYIPQVSVSNLELTLQLGYLPTQAPKVIRLHPPLTSGLCF